MKSIGTIDKTIIKVNEYEGKMNTCLSNILKKIKKYFRFDDYIDDEISLDEYLSDLSILIQTEGICFCDVNAKNIPLDFVKKHIEINGYITYNEFINYAI